MSILQVLFWPLRHRRRKGLDNDPPSERDLPRLTPAQYEQVPPLLAVTHGDKKVRYFTPNRFTQWRVETLFDKEPDTISWIAGFARDEIFVDIGANVGMYTIWAAMTRGVRAYAFEPESQNFAILCRNILLNDLGRLGTPYCAALSDEEAFALLYLSEFQGGSSCHTFGAPLDHNLAVRRVGITQGSISSTLDLLVARGTVPVPHHIKIDVDGLEHKVLAGCRDTLRNARVKSVLVEINTNLAEHRQIVEELQREGFRYSREQVTAAQRKEGAFKGVGNYVFQR